MSVYPLEEGVEYLVAVEDEGQAIGFVNFRRAEDGGIVGEIAAPGAEARFKMFVALMEAAYAILAAETEALNKVRLLSWERILTEARGGARKKDPPAPPSNDASGIPF